MEKVKLSEERGVQRGAAHLTTQARAGPQVLTAHRAASLLPPGHPRPWEALSHLAWRELHTACLAGGMRGLLLRKRKGQDKTELGHCGWLWMQWPPSTVYSSLLFTFLSLNFWLARHRSAVCKKLKMDYFIFAREFWRSTMYSAGFIHFSLLLMQCLHSGVQVYHRLIWFFIF